MAERLDIKLNPVACQTFKLTIKLFTLTAARGERLNRLGTGVQALRSLRLFLLSLLLLRLYCHYTYHYDYSPYYYY